MEEYQIDPEPLIVDPQPALAADEGEIVAEFQQEVFEVADQRLFEVAFRILIFQVEKFQDEWVLDLLLGGKCVTGLAFCPLREHGRLVAGQKRALVKLRADLAVELANGPAAAQCFGFVEEACLVLVHR